MSEPTALQKHILRVKRDHEEWTAREIADECDCSESYVHETLGEFSPGDLEQHSGSSEPETADNDGAMLSGISIVSILIWLFFWPILIPLKVLMWLFGSD